jgi:hypothetical protein
MLFENRACTAALLQACRVQGARLVGCRLLRLSVTAGQSPVIKNSSKKQKGTKGKNETTKVPKSSDSGFAGFARHRFLRTSRLAGFRASRFRASPPRDFGESDLRSLLQSQVSRYGVLVFRDGLLQASEPPNCS